MYSAKSTTDPVLVLRIIYSKFQTKYTSSLYSPAQIQNLSLLFSTVHYRPSASPPYTLQLTIEPVIVIHILIHYRSSTSPPYNLQSKIGTVPVFRIFHNPFETQCQFSVFSTVHCRPCSSPLYALQPTTEAVPVLRILYSPLQIKLQSPPPPLYLQSTTDPDLVHRIFCRPPQT